MSKHKVALATLLLIMANLFVGAYFLARRSSVPPDPELITPRLAVSHLTAKSLFYTPAAREELRAQRPELLAEAEEKAFELAAQNPASWRQLDHRLHFDAVLLTGDAGGYRPLLRHLLETHDWVLCEVDPMSLVLKRAPAPEWQPEDLDTLGRRFAGASRPVFLVSAANKLLALGETQRAKGFLDEAIRLAPDSADARTQLALYHAQIGQWNEALENCNRALAIDQNAIPALSAKAQILFGAKRFDEALDVSEQMVAALPREPSALFLHAKIAHEAHAFQREIVALKSLIELAEKAGAPLSGYRIYLAQAYAASSQAQPSLEQFEKAAASGELTPEQRTFVDESIRRIKSRM